jgi:hypothetical protein
MPVQGGLVNTRSGQERLPRQFLPNCTFSVGIVAMALEGAGDVDNPGIRARSVSSCRNASIPAIEKPPQKPVGWRSGYEGRILASKGQSASTPLPSPVAAVSVNWIDCAIQIGIVVATALTDHRTGPSDRIDCRHGTGATCTAMTDAIHAKGSAASWTPS